jgi:hypothetical protein
MIHLSRFLIGIRHNRAFRIKNVSGQLVDELLKTFPNKFPRVSEAQADEFILRSERDNIFLKVNRDDVILDNLKLYDFEESAYIEVTKEELLDMAEKSLPVVAEKLSLQRDIVRVGMLFEFRIPRWAGMKASSFGAFVTQHFINFPIEVKESDNIERLKGDVRFSYKLRAPGGASIKGLKDFRNVILRINDSTGLDEKGKEQKCLFLSVDIQHIFDPLRKYNDIALKDHYQFAKEHPDVRSFPPHPNEKTDNRPILSAL